MSKFKYSAGPWNVAFRCGRLSGRRCGKRYRLQGKGRACIKKIGFDAVQFHDDDAVPEMNDLSDSSRSAYVQSETKKILDDNGMAAEFVAPRLWMDPRTVDGGYTSNSAPRTGNSPCGAPTVPSISQTSSDVTRSCCGLRVKALLCLREQGPDRKRKQES